MNVDDVLNAGWSLRAAADYAYGIACEQRAHDERTEHVNLMWEARQWLTDQGALEAITEPLEFELTKYTDSRRAVIFTVDGVKLRVRYEGKQVLNGNRAGTDSISEDVLVIEVLKPGSRWLKVQDLADLGGKLRTS